jgi:hypothetical protein
MPPKRDTKKNKIPDIPWTEDNNLLIWSLLNEIEKPANYKVLFGKKDKDEVKAHSILSGCRSLDRSFSQNTSGERKVTVYKRIGQALVPNLFAINPNVVADRMKGKLES